MYTFEIISKAIASIIKSIENKIDRIADGIKEEFDSFT